MPNTTKTFIVTEPADFIAVEIVEEGGLEFLEIVKIPYEGETERMRIPWDAVMKLAACLQKALGPATNAE